MKYILANGSELHVEALSDSIFRLRLRKPYDRESGMNRYGMI